MTPYEQQKFSMEMREAFLNTTCKTHNKKPEIIIIVDLELSGVFCCDKQKEEMQKALIKAYEYISSK